MLNKSEQMLQTSLKSLKGLAKEKEEQLKAKIQIANQHKEQIFNQNQLNSSLEQVKKIFKNQAEQLQKVQPLYSTVRRVLDAARNIEGVKGLLADFIQCDPEVQPCVDIAAKNKLFAIVVDQMETAKKLLEINAEIKGQTITIHPLDMLDEIELRDNVKVDRGVLLSEKVHLSQNADPRLEPLIKNIFNRVVLVEDLPQAQVMSKAPYKLTAITSNYETVYAGGFVQKLGHFNPKFEQLQAYRKVQETEKKMKQHIQKGLIVEKEVSELQLREANVSRILSKIDLDFAKLKD